MKRYNNLFEQICSIENIELADKKARLHKSNNYGIKIHDKHKQQDYKKLRKSLLNGTYKTSKYSTFKIYEPKERIIFRLPYYPDRIVHHCIMNILEPIWVSVFTEDTYACIKNRGIHAIVKKLKKILRKDINGTKYCLKLDITKFYPSIDHKILKKIIRKKIKDKKLLCLLDSIIDSAEGVPIGNYLSQFFANLYLAYFDHWVKEVLKVKYYYRYADDIVILCDNKEQLRQYLIKIKEYLITNLKLKIKNNYQIFPVDSRGIDFVGYRFYHTHTLLRKSMKYKIKKLIRKYNTNQIPFIKMIKSLQSYFGWLKHCNSKNLLQHIQQKIGIKYSNWDGKETIISNVYNKWIFITDVIVKNKYFKINFIHHNTSYTVKSKSIKLLTRIKVLFNPFIIKNSYWVNGYKNYNK